MAKPKQNSDLTFLDEALSSVSSIPSRFYDLLSRSDEQPFDATRNPLPFAAPEAPLQTSNIGDLRLAESREKPQPIAVNLAPEEVPVPLEGPTKTSSSSSMKVSMRGSPSSLTPSADLGPGTPTKAINFSDMGALEARSAQNAAERARALNMATLAKTLADAGNAAANAKISDSDALYKQTLASGELGAEAFKEEQNRKSVEQNMRAVDLSNMNSKQKLERELAQNQSDSQESRTKQKLALPMLKRYLGLTDAEIKNMSANQIEDSMKVIDRTSTLKSLEDQRALLSLQRAESTKTKQDLKSQENVDKQVLKASERFQKSGLLELSDTMDQIRSELDAAGGLEGQGFLTRNLPEFLKSSRGQKLSQLIQGLANVKLKERSGAAVSANELARFNGELGAGKYGTPEQLLNGLNKLRRGFNLDSKNIITPMTAPGAKDVLFAGIGFNPVEATDSPLAAGDKAQGTTNTDNISKNKINAQLLSLAKIANASDATESEKQSAREKIKIYQKQLESLR